MTFDQCSNFHSLIVRRKNQEGEGEGEGEFPFDGLPSARRIRAKARATFCFALPLATRFGASGVRIALKSQNSF